MDKEKVLIIGASPEPTRYANMAAHMLLNYGHEILLFGKHRGEISGHRIGSEFPENEIIDTVTLYINPMNQEPVINKILALKPKRVIFNPGTENVAFEEQLSAAGIEPVEACTLVMLRTGQW